VIACGLGFTAGAVGERETLRGEGPSGLTAGRFGGLDAPFLEMREMSCDRAIDADAMLALLDSEDHRVRAGAARILSRIVGPKQDASSVTALRRLLGAFLVEGDRVVRVEMARALARNVGLRALEEMLPVAGSERGNGTGRSSEEASRSDEARRALVHQLVLEGFRATLEEITDPTGEIKGLYRNPFGFLSPLGRDAVAPVVGIARSGEYDDSIRALAVRAAGDVAAREAIPVLEGIYDRHLATAIEREERRLEGERPDRAWDDHLFRACLYTLFRLGDPRPFLAWQDRLREWRDDPRARADLLLALDHQFSLAYNYQQVKSFRKACNEYLTLLDDLRACRIPIPWLAETVAYNLACIYALEGRTAYALEYLELAIAWGFRDRDWLLRDADLDSVREAPEFQAILDRLR